MLPRKTHKIAYNTRPRDRGQSLNRLGPVFFVDLEGLRELLLVVVTVVVVTAAAVHLVLVAPGRAIAARGERGEAISAGGDKDANFISTRLWLAQGPLRPGLVLG